MHELSTGNSLHIQSNSLSPSGNTELGSATTKTDIAERSMSIGRESLRVCLGNRRRGVLERFTASGQSWRNMAMTGDKNAVRVLEFAKTKSIVPMQRRFRTKYHTEPKQFVSGTRNSRRLAAYALRNEEGGRGHRPRMSSVYSRHPLARRLCIQCATDTWLRHLQFPARAMCWLGEGSWQKLLAHARQSQHLQERQGAYYPNKLGEILHLLICLLSAVSILVVALPSSEIPEGHHSVYIPQIRCKCRHMFITEAPQDVW
jgi:hypothetical protein